MWEVLVNKTFYCKTLGCKTRMTLVNAANPENAYFRKIPSSPDHLSVLCSADGFFEPTKYEENRFNFEDLADKIMSEMSDKRIHGSSSVELHGGGGRKSISTVKQIYLMCRKYTEYNGIKTNGILADERNFEQNKNTITGKKIVQCTYYHKVYNEFSLIMNYPSFPYKNGKHIRIDFEDENLFWEFYRKVKPSNHKELILILGDWKTEKIRDEYIARCTVYRKRQYSFLKS